MKITHERTLEYYDCALIFEASDDAGQWYVAVHHDDYPTGCEYAVTSASQADLGMFKDGYLSLRSLMLNTPGREWYTTRIDADTEEIILRRQSSPVTDCDSLPDEDNPYYLVERPNIEPENVAEYRPLASSKNGSPSTNSQLRLSANALPPQRCRRSTGCTSGGPADHWHHPGRQPCCR